MLAAGMRAAFHAKVDDFKKWMEAGSKKKRRKPLSMEAVNAVLGGKVKLVDLK